jgi:hypothetical protein
MGFPGQGADSPIMSDAFIAFRLFMNQLDDLSLAIDPTKSRVRTNIEESILLDVKVNSGTLSTVSNVTNIVNLGGRDATLFQNDIMDKIFFEAIRQQII